MTRLSGVARARYVIANYSRVLAAVLVVTGVLALGGAGWAITHPETTTVTDHTEKMTVRSSMGTSATVTGNSTLYPEGKTLENRLAYFREASPTLDLSLVTSIPEAESGRVNQQLELVVRAKNEDGVLWSRNRTLDDTSARLGNGDVTSGASISIPELDRELRPIRNEIGPTATVSVYIRVTTTYETDQYSGRLSRTVPLSVNSHAYRLEPVTLETTESTPVERTVTIPQRDTTGQLLLGMFGLLSIAGAGGVLVSQRRLDSMASLKQTTHHARYADWISEGRLSTGVGEQFVPLSSLGDLVDLAIDSQKRVIHDTDLDAYAVIDDRVVYYFGPDIPWVTEQPSSDASHSDSNDRFQEDPSGDRNRTDAYPTGDGEYSDGGIADGGTTQPKRVDAEPSVDEELSYAADDGADEFEWPLAGEDDQNGN